MARKPKTRPFDFKELNGSGTEEFGADRTSATRIFMVPWSDRLEFMGLLFQASPASLTYPDIPELVFVEAKCEGLGKPGMAPKGQIRYDFAKITATYRGGKIAA